MQKNIFTPKMSTDNSDSDSGTKQNDSLKDFLRNSAKTILVVMFSLLPILFVPQIFTSLDLTKTYLVVIGVLAALVLLSLSILRDGRLRILLPKTLVIFWGFGFFALASALLSGDKHDAIFGNVLEVNTVSFFILMALVMTSVLVFTGSRTGVLRLFIGLMFGAVLLQLYHLLRLIFGPDFLSFGLFATGTSSPIGSFNDLALFSGLVIVITITAMQQISVNLMSKVISVALVVLSLLLLMAVNFFAVWIIVGLFSLLALLYILSKDTWLKRDGEGVSPVSKTVLGLTALVCLVSASFVVSGEYLGSKISNITGTNYLEVRPSTEATFDIARSVYAENVLFGAGPNRFEDAWRLYKNPVINETVFWNTDFKAGSGFVPTTFITTGAVGGGLLVLFILVLLYTGYKTLLIAKSAGNMWYFAGTISLTSAIYLWLVMFIYVPGATIMLLTALMSGLVLVVYYSVSPKSGFSVDVLSNRLYGLSLIVAVLFVVVASVAVAFDVSKKYISQVAYAEAVKEFQVSNDLALLDEDLAAISQLNQKQDTFIAERAQIRLAEVNRLISVSEPNEGDVQNFQTALVEGINLAERAVALDPTNPYNHLLLASFYGVLDPGQYEGVEDRKNALLEKARQLHPTGPEQYLLSAQLATRFGDIETAKEDLAQALQLKSNFSNALYLLTQIDIQEGNTESAITNARAMVSIEPRNPSRYLQLGILLSSASDTKGAIEAFEAAVTLDNNYANARYFLALSYLDDGRPDDALTQLRVVEATNQDNRELKNLIAQIEEGNYSKPGLGFETPVNDQDAVIQEGEVTTTTESPDTDLITPVNQVGYEDQREALDGDETDQINDSDQDPITNLNDQTNTGSAVNDSENE